MILTTDRLTLREIQEGDIDAVYSMLSDPDVMRYWPRPYDQAGSRDWIARQKQRYKDDGCGYWLAIETATGEVVGQAGVLMHEVEGENLPGLGYIIRKEHWGKGLATEAARGCLAWSRKRYPRTVCLVQPRNEPSLRVAQRLGLQACKTVDYKGLPHLVFTDADFVPPGEMKSL